LFMAALRKWSFIARPVRFLSLKNLAKLKTSNRRAVEVILAPEWRHCRGSVAAEPNVLRGRAKNSARPANRVLLEIIRAGFEPFRACANSTRLPTSAKSLAAGEVTQPHRRGTSTARLKTGARQFRPVAERRARRVFRPTDQGSYRYLWDRTLSVYQAVAHRKFLRFDFSDIVRRTPSANPAAAEMKIKTA
jgi:hypothetical protein